MSVDVSLGTKLAQLRERVGVLFSLSPSCCVHLITLPTHSRWLKLPHKTDFHLTLFLSCYFSLVISFSLYSYMLLDKDIFSHPDEHRERTLVHHHVPASRSGKAATTGRSQFNLNGQRPITLPRSFPVRRDQEQQILRRTFFAGLFILECSSVTSFQLS